MSVLAAYAVPHPPLILPAIGAGREQEIAHTVAAYREVMRAAAELRPDTVVVISPHAVVYEDYFHISPGEHAEGNFAAFGHPAISVGVDYDEDFVRALAATAMDHDIPAGTLGERAPALDHATMIPLAFLSDYLGDAPVKVVRIGVSGLHFCRGRAAVASHAVYRERRSLASAQSCGTEWLCGGGTGV